VGARRLSDAGHPRPRPRLIFVEEPGPEVHCDPTADGWRCLVRFGPEPDAAEHEVTLDRATLEDLAPGATPESLVDASFRFLLEREPPQAILRRFELPIIGRYFADFPDEIRRRMAR
jgi:hypothetical protein